MIKDFAIILSATLVITVVVFFSYGALEPQFAKAVTAQVVVTLNVTQGISLTNSGDSSMSTALGVSQMSAVGTTTWTVITNDAAGYTLALNSTGTPAMQATAGGYTIADYQTGVPSIWTATTGSAYFGYSGFGNDTPTATWGTGASCGASANGTSTTLKYQGLATTSAAYVSQRNIASRTSTTTPTGVTTTACYAVEQNNYFVPAATYKATVVGTATPL